MIDVRRRRTRGVTRSRLELEARRSVRPLVVFVACLLASVPFAAWLVSNLSETFLRSTVELRFEVSDSFGVLEDFDEVRYRGVPAGTITGIERDGEQLVLTARLQERYAPIHRDARAQVRSVTPLNDVYLDIVDPGTEAAGVADASTPLPEAQTTSLVTVPDVLDSLRSNERRAMHVLLADLGRGLDDRGRSLRRAFVEIAPFLEVAGRLSAQVADRERATRRLVSNTATLTDALAEREEMLRRLVASTSATVGTLQRSAPQLDATLAELPGVVEDVTTTLAGVRGAVDDVDGGLGALVPVAERLQEGLDETRRLVADLDPAVRSLEEPVSELRPLARSLDPLSDAARGTIVALQSEVDTLDRLTERVARCMPGIIGFFQWNASLSKYGDAHGPIPRGNLAIGAPDLGTPGAARRDPAPNCTPGRTIGGRPSRPRDES